MQFPGSSTAASDLWTLTQCTPVRRRRLLSSLCRGCSYSKGEQLGLSLRPATPWLSGSVRRSGSLWEIKGLLKLQTQRDSCSVHYPDCQVKMIRRRSDTVTPCVRGEANSGHQMPKSGAGTANRKSCRVTVLWLGLRPPHLRMLLGAVRVSAWPGSEMFLESSLLP